MGRVSILTVTLAKNRKKIFLSLFTWSVAFLFITIFFGLYSQDYWTAFVFCLCFVPLAFVCTRLLNHYLIPRYLLQKRYFRFGLYLFYLLCFSVWIETLLISGLLVLMWDYSLAGIDPASIDIRFLFVGLYFVIIVGVAYRQQQRILQEQNLKEQQNRIQMETELRLKEAELHLLKAQVNPHFLFNSLNSIYGLSLEKSEEAPRMIMLLSEILDYTLYGCNHEFVSLQQEIDLIKNYTAIQQGRFGDAIHVNMDLQQAEHVNVLLAPLLFLPLVENCFKHCARSEMGVSEIFMKMTTDTDLVFQLTNPLGFPPENRKKGGIGLENLKKRLELIYPQKHQLSIRTTHHLFDVELRLQILNPQT